MGAPIKKTVRDDFIDMLSDFALLKDCLGKDDSQTSDLLKRLSETIFRTTVPPITRTAIAIRSWLWV
jgi:hypothetical protein